MYVLPFLLILVLVAAKLGSLLDPRRNAKLFMKYHTDSVSGWDWKTPYDPERRKEILALMIKKEESGESNWYQTYKSALDPFGITELEVKRAIERRKNGIRD
ncbi:MAG: hypothetical protein HY986_17180 [Candidatus Melainabacteria bacterium]|jgi:hypothetical protein|nr:hypothetical protein [Candidatus Melainabacteria bacterium]